jgi:tRNA/tmRNA/rRNA uracil-C5-methylase (TrmA/RlmC/RlmD family)
VESATAQPRPQAPQTGIGDVLELTLTGVAHGGWCVARQAGGLVVFVRHALPGERVLARVTDTTSSFARADAVEVLEPSPDRVTPRCPHAHPGGCGGCDWQHASLPAQRAFKAEVISEQLRRIAGIDREVTVEPVPGDDEGLGWRTRMRFSVDRDGRAGLLAHRSHEVIAVGDCPIAHPLIQVPEVTGQRWAADSVEVAAAPATGERAVIATPPGTAAGPLHQRAAGRTWRVSPAAFWQVHPGLADALTGAVLDILRPQPGDVALDLFCGAGLFAGTLAAEVGPDGAVIAVDSDATAVADARHNLRGTPWARVYTGDVARVLARGGWRPPGLAVLDPPRTGVSRRVIERVLVPPGAGRMHPGQGRQGQRRPGQGRPARGRVRSRLRRVAYVSCDPATLARDIAVFAEYGWRLDGLRAFDAFPMTHHVECVAALTPR